MNKLLTGVEKNLVLKYLIDKKICVTIVPGFFVVSLDVDDVKDGVLYLTKCPFNFLELENQKVKVFFYYEKLGLSFESVLKNINGRYGLVSPSCIGILEDEKNFVASAFHARLTDVGVNCSFLSGYKLFEKPSFDDIEKKYFDESKELIEYIVKTSRQCGKSIGNGLCVIPVAKYLLETVDGFSTIKDRAFPPAIIYIDSKLMVFASLKRNLFFKTECDYNIEMGFNIEKSPVKERIVKAIVSAEQIYESADRERVCVISSFKELKNEDVRFIMDQSVRL